MLRRPPFLGHVDTGSNGPTDRVQLPDLLATSVTIQADDTNTSAVYIGDHTVTNASGVKKGIKLNAGDPYSNQQIENLKELFVVGDNANQNIIFLAS